MLVFAVLCLSLLCTWNFKIDEPKNRGRQRSYSTQLTHAVMTSSIDHVGDLLIFLYGETESRKNTLELNEGTDLLHGAPE